METILVAFIIVFGPIALYKKFISRKTRTVGFRPLGLPALRWMGDGRREALRH
jgi:hypothetical protein